MGRCFEYFPSIKKSVCNQRIICAVETRGRRFLFPLRAVHWHRPHFAAHSPVKMSRRRKFCAGFTNCLHSSLGCGKLSVVSGMRRKGELPGAALNKTVMTKPDREGARVPG